MLSFLSLLLLLFLLLLSLLLLLLLLLLIENFDLKFALTGVNSDSPLLHSLLDSDLTAAIREELEKETDELHRMLRDLRHKLMDLKASGALGGKSGLQQTASEEKRRKTELLRRLAEGSMTEEDRQKALEELGLQNASPEELDAYLKQQANASLEVVPGPDVPFILGHVHATL